MEVPTKNLIGAGSKPSKKLIGAGSKPSASLPGKKISIHVSKLCKIKSRGSWMDEFNLLDGVQIVLQTPTGIQPFGISPDFDPALLQEADPHLLVEETAKCLHRWDDRKKDNFVQTRAGDEMPTLVVKCLLCGVVKYVNS